MKKISKKQKTYFGHSLEEDEMLSKKDDDFTRENIYSILEKTPHPLRLDDILRRANVTRRSKKEVLSLLHELVKEGKVIHQRGGTYCVSTSLGHIQGKLAVQRSGAAFVLVNKEKFPQVKEDIYIPEHSLNDAWNGDIVEVALLPRPQRAKGIHPQSLMGSIGKRREGKVVEIIERTHKVLTVCIDEEAARQQQKHFKHLATQGYLAKPTDSRFNFTVLIPLTEDFLQQLTEKGCTLKQGDLAEVEIQNRLPSRMRTPLWLALPKKFLGGQHSVSVQETITKTSNNIPTEFPDDVLKEAENIAIAEGFLKPEQEQKNYRISLEQNDTDLRSLCLVTIDGSDSRDFDDAIYVEKTAQGYLLLVAIADVSRYVTPYSKLDKEAKHRGNSYYFPSSVEPMLPEALSNGLCSLRPDEDHRIIFAKILFNAKGQVKATDFGQGIMRSKARLTYDVVQEFYDTGKAQNDGISTPMSQEMETMLLNAKELAEILIKKRYKAGSLHLEIPEQQCIIENNTMIALGVRPHFFAHELIEAFMVSANEAVAEFLYKKNAPCLYRIHPAPAPERLKNLCTVFAQTSLAEILPAETPEKIGEHVWLGQILAGLETAKKMAEQLEAKQKTDNKHDPEKAEHCDHTELAEKTEFSEKNEHIISIAKNSYLAHRMILRAMMQARYSPYLDIHFGLASKCYCHFTSPIRRYADLMVHRSLKAQLGIMEKKHTIFTPEYLEQIADICNDQERTAQSAEREVFLRLSCLMLEKSIGKTFPAIISGLSNFGVFAELQENMAEGMIRMEKLGDDYFVYDEERQILYGERTGITYRLGDELTVQIDFVDVTRLEIDLILMGVTPRRTNRAKGKSALFRDLHRKTVRPAGKSSRKGDSKKTTTEKRSKNTKHMGKERQTNHRARRGK